MNNRVIINQVFDLIIKRNIDFYINLNYDLVILFIKIKFINYNNLDFQITYSNKQLN